jgi:tRNA(Arg) A34 adenosine deaminase TadA
MNGRTAGDLNDRRSASLWRNDLNFRMATAQASAIRITAADEARLTALVHYTAQSFKTAQPVCFGALIVHSESGETLMRGRNAVARENDPSSHAEVRTVRLACKKRKSSSLAGYTLYSTCEPCPMCMANALWAGLDRVVFGATIEDANQYCRQIQIPATEVAQRSDMQCIVNGPVLRELCNTLFTHPRMQAAFATWGTRKR